MIFRSYQEGVYSFLQDNSVLEYPSNLPYNPPKAYPELDGLIHPSRIDRSNLVYPLVREALIALGLDKKHLSTSEWNPLSDVVSSGEKIIIKPNLVIDGEFLPSGIFQASVTHPSVIRPIIDYIYKATEGQCDLIIADAPLEGTSFNMVCEKLRLYDTIRYLTKRYTMRIKLMDLRDYCLKRRLLVKLGDYRIQLLTKEVLRSLKNYMTIDLERYSEFDSIADELKDLVSTRTFIRKVPSFAQSKGHHKYTISKELLDADVIFNFPKLKTHKFAGVTLSLKNLLGSTINRHYFGHYRKQGVSSTLFDSILGDLTRLHFKDIFAILVSRKRSSLCPKPVLRAPGSGIRNDTIWRAILDITRIILYANKDGIMTEEKQRRQFVVVDGIIAGEGEGPLIPTPKKCGIVITGFNPLLVDVLCARSMGFDPMKIKTIRESLKPHKYPISSFLNHNRLDLFSDIPNFHFRPPSGWESVTI